jgi:uncharacterized membrane protein YkvA (DUF1232 family)
MKSFFLDLKIFIYNVSIDQRIPARDKKILLVLIVLILSPIDFIPDWIPTYGLIDDFFMLALVFDYFFEVLDQSVLLSHFPWSMKVFSRLQRIGHFFAFFAPNFIRFNLWQYKKEPF